MPHVFPLVTSSPVLRHWFWASFAGWMVLEAWVWLREAGGTQGENRDRGSRLWVVAWVWIGIYAAFTLMWSAPSGAWRRGAVEIFIAGIALMWLGVFLRGWAIVTLGRFFRTSVILQGEHRIVMHGPYSFIRNPSYSGAVLTMLGLGLAMNNFYSVAALLACILIAYGRRITVEQQALVEHFGQPYRDYIKRTWALIPFVW
jgi:protein-S-isoprenylcysteine O-methyltransferase Ste14